MWFNSIYNSINSAQIYLIFEIKLYDLKKSPWFYKPMAITLMSLWHLLYIFLASSLWAFYPDTSSSFIAIRILIFFGTECPNRRASYFDLFICFTYYASILTTALSIFTENYRSSSSWYLASSNDEVSGLLFSGILSTTTWSFSYGFSNLLAIVFIDACNSVTSLLSY